MLLLIDNYDSFAHNLARYFERLGQETRVVRNDATTAAKALAMRPAAVVLSPGPCTPSEAGCSVELVRRASGVVPLLGVCLGHQAIAAALGGRIVRAPAPVHGQTSPIDHDGRGLFAGLPRPLTVCRYHSLIVERESLPDLLDVTATTADGIVMALTHRAHPTFGVQFHPEAILTEGGYGLLANFLAAAGLSTSVDVATLSASERRLAVPTETAVPRGPVTF
ncbi:MAG: aminodeoxychorismate/anthranilate synthase component II [Pirellulales bacterium]|nr:aminodeoxychorismate/anthranilate synthase component II [Pirellulales bacterium]